MTSTNIVSRQSIGRVAQRVAHAYGALTISPDYINAATPMAAARRSIRFGLMASTATLAVFLIGGALAPLESATASHGMIVPSDYKKTVQHLEGGIIDAIMVKDGDEVTAGQPLVRLSNVGASATQGITATQLFTARVSQARLEALQADADAMALDDAIRAQAAANPQLQEIVSSQQRLFTSDREAERDKLAIYEQQIAQLHEEKEGLQAHLKSAQAQLGFVNESLETEKGLVEQGFSTRPRLLSLEGQSEELQAKVGEYSASLGKSGKTELEIRAKISNEKHSFQSKVADELRAARETGIELEKKLSSASDVLSRTVITAPISGVVNGFKFHTVGGVIPAGSAIMDIVPKGDRVLVDAQVLPRDISRVHAGQEANIMFSSYKSRITPMVKGTVVQVAADRYIPPAGPDSPASTNGYYLTRVEIEKSALEKLATPVTLKPGMPVEVMVVDGERSLLSYYVRPFFDSFRRAFREQ